MRHRLYVHLIWTTRERAPLISASIASFLTRFLPAIAAQEYAGMIAIGMVSTHVHMLVRLSPATDIS
jgi:REP element-mobilizing transposase RayT